MHMSSQKRKVPDLSSREAGSPTKRKATYVRPISGQPQGQDGSAEPFSYAELPRPDRHRDNKSHAIVSVIDGHHPQRTLSAPPSFDPERHENAPRRDPLSSPFNDRSAGKNESWETSRSDDGHMESYLTILDGSQDLKVEGPRIKAHNPVEGHENMAGSLEAQFATSGHPLALDQVRELTGQIAELGSQSRDAEYNRERLKKKIRQGELTYADMVRQLNALHKRQEELSLRQKELALQQTELTRLRKELATRQQKLEQGLSRIKGHLEEDEQNFALQEHRAQGVPGQIVDLATKLSTIWNKKKD